MLAKKLYGADTKTHISNRIVSPNVLSRWHTVVDHSNVIFTTSWQPKYHLSNETHSLYSEIQCTSGAGMPVQRFSGQTANEITHTIQTV